MSVVNKTEVWLRGPLPGVLPALQPVAHALLQAREELNDVMSAFPGRLLWKRPAGVASVAFHLQHMTGVLDRLLTYAHAQMLSAAQLQYISEEGKEQPVTVNELVQQFNRQVDKALDQIKNTAVTTLFETRAVGRAQIPSTVMGLMVHAAEHTMRHLGQLLVTVKIIQSQEC